MHLEAIRIRNITQNKENMTHLNYIYFHIVFVIQNVFIFHLDITFSRIHMSSRYIEIADTSVTQGCLHPNYHIES